MNVRYLRLLWLWGGILALLLCLLFLPLASGGCADTGRRYRRADFRRAQAGRSAGR